MQPIYKKSLFIFRRDLRIQDNRGLMQALIQSKSVIPCFIFDDRQVGKQNNYRSLHSIQFMIESLKNLHDELKNKGGKLFIFEGIAEKVVAKLIKHESIDAVFCNRDYTPFSIVRDRNIHKACHDSDIEFIHCNDLLLVEPEEIKTGSGTPYTVFTPFYNKAKTYEVEQPARYAFSNLYKGALSESTSLREMQTKLIKKQCATLGKQPGRQAGIAILQTIEKFKDYKKIHNICSLSTTHLSAHLKFGTISIRETWHAIEKKLGKQGEPLLRQLYWRDFFTHIGYNFPYVYGRAFRKKYEHLFWKTKGTAFKAWCQGKTGFPIVDAGMREMNQTGYMHNRARLITGSFLVKDLHHDWKLGEKYFAQQLIDYDPALNNGNWQWVASTGCDAQPFFRIFNPWTQQKKFDPECVYIKKWVPELKDYKPSVIHTLFKKNSPTIPHYPFPIVDHGKESEYSKKLYRKK